MYDPIPYCVHHDVHIWYMVATSAGNVPNTQGGKPRHGMHIPAPKVKLPGHAESYNPPPEYLPTEDEVRVI